MKPLPLQIWNTNAALYSKATVIQKVRSLVPKINLLSDFYKRKSLYFFD